jgi:hypothetical protein
MVPWNLQMTIPPSRCIADEDDDAFGQHRFTDAAAKTEQERVLF